MLPGLGWQATRLVVGVLERAQALADWDAHPYARRVAELVVFGSYLRPEVDQLGDVDLAVLWEPRFADPSAQYEYGRTRSRAAWQAGRTWRNYFEEMTWPEVEVVRHLKGRSPAVSLCDLEENGEFVRGVPHRVVYELRSRG